MIKGTLVTIYLKNGENFSGALIEMNKDEGVLLKTISGDRVLITNMSEIVAFKYSINKKEKPIVDKSPEESKEIEHTPGDIENLVKLRKLKHEEEVKNIRKKILKAEPTTESVEYGNTLSAMHAVKINTKDKN
jgi:hypothetical protein